ncbi:MAG: glycosyltransferase family 4 protein [Bacteroidales bacterium]|nr:glycosyltransferase family 4 protein [Bacteroidales bacterium]
MKVLWITNILFPEVLAKLTGQKELKSTGGWLMGAANILEQKDEIELSVAAVSTLVKKLKVFQGERITYYVLPYGNGNQKYNKDYEHLWIEVKKLAEPDVVHLHGTEYAHGLAYINACGSDNMVVSIQGMKSAYRYYYYGLTKWDIFSHLTFRDVIKGSIIKECKIFKKQSEYEKEIIRNVKHIIGRTSWDRANTWAINPNLQYHFCNETLRSEFYDGSRWSYDTCQKHTIFLSQAGYPIKGLHQVLRAMPLVLQHYPDTKIRIAGEDITNTVGYHNILRFKGYGRIIKSMIKKYHLENRILFTGSLNADEMKQEYLKCNLFICPSTIENSPNSLGEAQILGTPVIASYVGGVPDMMKGDEEHLYRFEEVSMLAEKICKVFANEDRQVDMVDVAKLRHNQNINSEQLLKIYNIVLRFSKILY